jgi:hypothetical protein
MQTNASVDSVIAARQIGQEVRDVPGRMAGASRNFSLARRRLY